MKRLFKGDRKNMKKFYIKFLIKQKNFKLSLISIIIIYMMIINISLLCYESTDFRRYKKYKNIKMFIIKLLIIYHI